MHLVRFYTRSGDVFQLLLIQADTWLSWHRMYKQTEFREGRGRNPFPSLVNRGWIQMRQILLSYELEQCVAGSACFRTVPYWYCQVHERDGSLSTTYLCANVQPCATLLFNSITTYIKEQRNNTFASKYICTSWNKLYRLAKPSWAHMICWNACFNRLS